jgi:hypothetical protein
MTYMVSATCGPTAMASSTLSAGQALEWIRRRRAVGADHFNIIDERERRLDEIELATRALAE